MLLCLSYDEFILTKGFELDASIGDSFEKKEYS